MAERDLSAYKARMVKDPFSDASGKTRKIVGLRTLFFYYKSQLRAHPLRELFTVVGVAAGVALLFAVQVANKSVTGSFEQLVRGIDGRASLEVAARPPTGFNQNIYRRIKRLKSVDAAAPIIDRQIGVRGPKGRRLLTLVGADERLGTLGGSLVTNAAQRSRSVARLGLQLTEPTANALGAKVGAMVAVEAGERLTHLRVAGVLSERAIGPLAESPVAVGHLGFAQDLLDMPGQITRALVVPKPGRREMAKSDLKHLVGDKLDVRASNTEAKLLQQAATPDRQSTALFSAISLIVGILLVYNAMLLSINDRRRFIAALHSWGLPRQTIVASLVFDALVLGVTGSLLGLLAGFELASHVLNQVPAFLSLAFPVGTQRVVNLSTIVLCFAAGIGAALIAAARPTIELLKTAARGEFQRYDFSLKDQQSALNRKRLFWAGLFLISVCTVLALAVPAIALAAIAVLGLGIMMVLPAIVAFLIIGGQRAARLTPSITLRIALGELAVNPMRATALAATGALALFAILAITGSGTDISRGQRQLTGDTFAPRDLWVSRSDNAYLTGTFDPRQVVRRIRHIGDIKRVYILSASLLDLPGRRLWVLGADPADQRLLAPSQIVTGRQELAKRRIQHGGWAALTATVAAKMHLRLGDRFALPTPTGAHRLRLAATITNYGWFPGTVLLNRNDYKRLWHSNLASLIGVSLRPGHPALKTRALVQRALGKNSALTVQTTKDRKALYTRLTDQGLLRIRQISTIVTIAVVLAVVAAMLAAISQRRERLWSLIAMGIRRREIYRTVFWEATLILLVGCLVGAVFGLVGQGLAGDWLKTTTGTPVPYSPAWGLALKTLGVIVALATAAVVLPLRFTLRLNREPLLQTD